MASKTCIILLLLLEIQTVRGFLEEEPIPVCRHCEAAEKPGLCSHTITCDPHEDCYTQMYTLVDNTVGYRLGCINRGVCSVLPKSFNGSHCFSCCNHDDCNSNLCVADNCPSPYYGPFCMEVCGHCANGEQCEKDTGKCSGGCEPGFVPPFCRAACQFPWYGPNCEKIRVCGNCVNGERCNATDGFCTNGCAPGYAGSLCNTETNIFPGDCSYIRDNMNLTTSGRYLTSVNGHTAEVWCDMTTEESGWIVFQRRINGTVLFERTWREYKNGFGDLSGEFWWGNDHLAEFTANESNVLRIELEEATGRRTYAEYRDFRVENENTNFRLHVGNYSGTAGDSMWYHHLMMFSTMDRDNDRKGTSCSLESGLGGWWFDACYYANLNGVYLQPGTEDTSGIRWIQNLGTRALKMVEMKFKSS